VPSGLVGAEVGVWLNAVHSVLEHRAGEQYPISYRRRVSLESATMIAAYLPLERRAAEFPYRRSCSRDRERYNSRMAWKSLFVSSQGME
jgi:hypothetical protein